MSSITKTRSTVSADAALRCLTAAIAKADEVGIPMTITILDEAGLVKASVRMDGASLISVESSRRKAYTAVASGAPSGDFFNGIKDDPMLVTGVPPQPNLMLVAGGYPLVEDGVVVGSIGVSGGHYTDDQVVAQAALAAIGI